MARLEALGVVRIGGVPIIRRPLMLPQFLALFQLMLPEYANVIP